MTFMTFMTVKKWLVTLIPFFLTAQAFAVEAVEAPDGSIHYVYTEEENEIVNQVLDENEFLLEENRLLIEANYNLQHEVEAAAYSRLRLIAITAGVTTAVHIILRLVLHYVRL